uniref:Protein H4 n=1 Tax=Rhabditophanes sp. KR3021 TaxID=114890 RepID=A0AC35UGV6_9BILA
MNCWNNLQKVRPCWQTRKTLSSVEKMVSLLDGIFNLIKLESELFIIDMLFGFSRYIMFKVDTTLTDTGEIWVKRKDFKEFIKNMFDYTYSVKRKPNALKLFLKAILTFTENPTCKDGIYNWMVDETLKTLKLLSVITGHAISKNYEYASNKSKDNFIEFIFILFEDTHIISEIPLKLVYRRNALVLILLKQCLKDKHYEGTIENNLTMQKIMGIFYINSIFAVKIKNCLKFGEVLDDNTIEMISMIYTLIELVGKLSTTSSQYKNVFDRICHEETLPMMIATGILSNSENLIAESLYINKVSPNYIFKTVANYIYESMKKRKDLSNDPCAKVNLSEKGYQDQINGNQIIIQKYLNENQLLNEELGKFVHVNKDNEFISANQDDLQTPTQRNCSSPELNTSIGQCYRPLVKLWENVRSYENSDLAVFPVSLTPHKENSRISTKEP